MPIDKINGVHLYWELRGKQGPPLVLVHGSWGDHHNWDAVEDGLSQTFRVLTYDRRGHSQSERPAGQGTLEEDASDLIALVEHTGLAPAHMVGNSGGATVVLKTAARQPGLFRTLVAHEPALFGLLKEVPEAREPLQMVQSRVQAVVDLIAKGDHEGAAKLFVETIAFGPGAWEHLPPRVQQTFIYNAPTFLDENGDPNSLYMDTGPLTQFDKPALLSTGTQSPPFFLRVIDTLTGIIPGARRMVFEGAGHVPHMSHPEYYVQAITEFCLNSSPAGAVEGAVQMDH